MQFDPHNKPIFFEELTQNQRLQAEIAMVEKVRGLKRKRESVEYRLDKYFFLVKRRRDCKEVTTFEILLNLDVFLSSE